MKIIFYCKPKIISYFLLVSKIILFYSFTIFCSATLNSQSKDLHTRFFNSKHGIEDPNIEYVVKDNLGFIWLYTRTCIMRYDGIHFKNYYDVPHIRHDINYLYVDHKGRLWANNGSSIYRYKPEIDSFKQIRLPEQTSSNDRVNFINQIDSNLYIYQHQELWKIGPNSDSAEIFANNLPRYDRAYNFLEKDYDLWLGNCHGTISLYNLKSGSIKTITNPFECAHYYYHFKLGELFFSTWGNGLVSYDKYTNQFKQYIKDTTKSHLHRTYSHIFSIPFYSGDSIIYSVPYTGNANPDIFNINSRSFETNYPMPSFTFLEQSNWYKIHHTYFDSMNHIIYIATNLGLFQCNIKQPKTKVLKLWDNAYKEHHYGFIFNKNKLPLEQNIITQSIDDFYFYDDTKKQKSSNILKLGVMDKEDFVLSWFARDFENNIWLSAPNGVFKLTSDFSKISKFYPIPYSDGHDDIRDIYVDANNKIWVGTKHGLFIIDPQKTNLQRINADDVVSLSYHHGYFTYCQKHEVIIYDENTILARRFDGRITNHDIFLNRSNDFFEVMTAHYNGQNSIWYTDNIKLYHKIFTSGQTDYEVSLTQNNLKLNIHYLYEDSYGAIWIVAQKDGLFRYNPTTKTLIKINSNTDIEYGDWKCIIPYDSVLIAYANGSQYLMIDPKQFLSNQILPVPYLFEIYNGREELNVTKFTERNKFASIKYNENSIFLKFSSLDFINNGKEFFLEYYVQELDTTWQPAIGWRVDLLKLKAGKYTIHTRIHDSNGNISDEGQLIRFSLVKPFTQSILFYSLIALISFFFIIRLTYNIISHRKAQEALRFQISRDLHDHLGSTLSTIALIGDAGQQGEKKKMKSDLKRISEEARELSSTLREFVWILKDTPEKSEELIARMNIFSNTILEAKNIQYHFLCEASAKQINFNLNHRKHIYFLYKEIINNIAKHSKATSVKIYIDKFENNFLLQIHDNGIGFDVTKTYGGSGLSNIRSRCLVLGAKIDITSSINQGSFFKILIPVQ